MTLGPIASESDLATEGVHPIWRPVSVFGPGTEGPRRKGGKNIAAGSFTARKGGLSSSFNEVEFKQAGSLHCVRS